MSIQAAAQNRTLSVGQALINIDSSPNQTGSLLLPKSTFERQRHVDVIEILREKKLPFLEKLMSQIDAIKRVYRETHDLQEIRTLGASLEKIQSAKYKTQGYFSRLFSQETWDEWTQDKTDLGKIVNLLEDHVQNGLPLKHFTRLLDKRTMKHGELEAKAVIESLSETAPSRLLRGLGSKSFGTLPLPQSKWKLNSAQVQGSDFQISGMPGISLNTNTVTSNVFLSERAYTLQCSSDGQSFPLLTLGVASLSFPQVSVVAGTNSQNNYVFLFQIPKGYNGPLNLTLSSSLSILIQGGSIFVAPSLSPMPAAPIINAPIPDQNAIVGKPFLYALPPNIFSDPQNSNLSLTATLESGYPLPSWFSFDVTVDPVLFYGTPSDSESLNITIYATNIYDQSAHEDFTINIQHILPVRDNEIDLPPQEATVGEPFTYSLPPRAFFDPVGNALTYTAMQSNGDHLPSWLSFEGQTFIGTPVSADEGPVTILVTAQDSFKGKVSDTFTVSVQPALISSSTIKAGLSVGIPILLLASIVGMLYCRKKRIGSIQNQVMAIDFKGASTSVVTAAELEEEFAKLQKEANHISLYNADQFQTHFLKFLERINTFCLGAPADSIFDLVNLHGLLNKLLVKIHDKTLRGTASWSVTLILSQTIHQLCDLIVLTETVSGRHVNETHKREFLHSLRETIERVPENNEDVRISDTRFHLECSSEAVRCMVDTGSLSRLLKASVYHVLSPSKLAGDIEAIFSNGPDQWYPPLLTMRSMVPLAINNLETLKELQKLILTQSDWHFYYESIEILGNIAKNGTTEEIRSQALNGTKNELGLVKFLQWAPYWIKKDRNSWLQNKAREEFAESCKAEAFPNNVETGEGKGMKEGVVEEKKTSLSIEHVREFPTQERNPSHSPRLIPPARESSLRKLAERVLPKLAPKVPPRPVLRGAASQEEQKL